VTDGIINNYISESLLYRSSRGLGIFTGEEIVKLFFSHTLVLCILLQDWATARSAVRYASQTGRRSGYSLFYTSCTDLYALAYMVDNPNSKRNFLQDRERSTAHLRSLNFNGKMHAVVMNRLSRSSFSSSELSTYLYRLEIQLGISNSELKALRRIVANWEQTTQGKKRATLNKLRRMLFSVGKTQNQELLKIMNRLMKSERFRFRSLRTPVGRLAALAGTAAGAIAGGAIGRAVGDKYTVPAAGLGAIAGYWATRRNRK
jgi:hypothetical protein